MCFNVDENNNGGGKKTIIHNNTENTIVLREKHRYVWRQVRMELKPQESKSISIKSPSTFFRLGAALKVEGGNEKDTEVRIDTEQLEGRNKLSICKDEKGRYYVREE